MKTLFGAAGIWFALAQALSALMVTLEWDRNTEPDVIGYTVKWGFVPQGEDHNVDAGNNTTLTISEPWSVGMTIYFVCTATNAAGLESGPSNEVSFTVNPWNPNAPGHLKILDLSK